MTAFTSSPGFNIAHVTSNYDWASLGRAQIVDVGGGHGHVAIELAKQFVDLKFVVQDMAQVVEPAKSQLPEDLQDRITFVAHDLFATQTVQADMFLFRWVLHNWSDKYCILILRAQIPALRPGVKVMIQDHCMPEPGTTALWREKYLRCVHYLELHAVMIRPGGNS